jgi:RNA polymerase sigma-70 factor, ECF subfamily
MNYYDIHQTYYTKVLRYLTRIIGEFEAEDLTQEVFIKVYENLQSLKDQSKISSWIYKIAMNVSRDKLRKMKKENISHSKHSFEDNPEQNVIEQIADKKQKSQDEKLIRQEMIQCYLDFVKKLPKNYHEAYVLSDFEGLSDKDIADRLALPLETVKIHIHRARKKLYDNLRTHCHCFYGESGELLAGPND